VISYNPHGLFPFRARANMTMITDLYRLDHLDHGQPGNIFNSSRSVPSSPRPCCPQSASPREAGPMPGATRDCHP